MAVQLAGELRPDVIVLDLMMSNEDAGQALRAIRCHHGAHIIVLTTHSHDDLFLRAVDAGVRSYLPRTIDPLSLVEAVRGTARGEAILHPNVGSRILSFMRSRRLIDSLTLREREVLACVARGHTNREIATGLHVSVETIKTHVSHILTKLGLHDRTKAAVYALEQGIVPRLEAGN